MEHLPGANNSSARNQESQEGCSNTVAALRPQSSGSREGPRIYIYNKRPGDVHTAYQGPPLKSPWPT